jgi:hypothetical protein
VKLDHFFKIELLLVYAVDVKRRRPLTPRAYVIVAEISTNESVYQQRQRGIGERGY